MHIALLTGEFPPMQGGVGAFTLELAKALADQGDDLTVISSRAARPEGVSRDVREPLDLGFARLVARGGRWQWRDMQMIADTVLRYQPDVLNIQFQAAAYNMRHPALYALPWRLRGVVKTVVTFHDLRVPYLFPKAGRLRDWVVRRLARDADGVIATNSADFSRLTTWRNSHNVAQIPIGSNITRHPVPSADIAALRQRLPANGHLLAFFGFLHPDKGPEELVAALAQLDPAVHLVFVGGQTGSSDPTIVASLAQLRAQIASLHLEQRVHWTGFVEDAQVSAWLESADLVVLPYRDGVSLRRGTLMAALAHGCALVTTESADTPLGTAAATVPPRDPAALAATIRHLLAHPDQRQSLGQAALTLSRQFTWPDIARQTTRFFHTLLP
jgi:glycosyltransferase involved in cell wall biosynthesis